jgi:hypothetical protein
VNLRRDSVRSYHPGDWFGIVGERAVVILPPTEKARVAALWELVDGGAGFDVTLDALISGGLRDLPAFVLVSTGDGETRVVIRGPARAEFRLGDEVLALEGSDATTWVERSLVEVERMSIVLHEDPLGSTGTSYVVDGGLFRISRLDESPAHEGPDELGEEPAYEREFPLPDDTEEDDVPPARSPEPPDWTPTPPPTRPPPPPPAPAGAAADAALPAHGSDVRGAGGDRSRRAHRDGRLAAPAALAARHPGASRPHGRHRPGRAAADLERRRGRRRPGGSSSAARPRGRRFNETEQPRLVTVPSPHLEISSTHIEVRPGSGADHGSAVVTDLGSTNGTVVVQPGLGPEDLSPGVTMQLIPGAIIDIGDGVTIQVTSP